MNCMPMYEKRVKEVQWDSELHLVKQIIVLREVQVCAKIGPDYVI